MKHHIIQILLSVLFLLALTACGAEDKQRDPAVTTSETESAVPSDPVPVEKIIEPDDIEEEEEPMLNIQAGDAVFTATLAENSSVDAFRELFADGPLTLDMKDFAGMEKGADLGVTLPQNNRQMDTKAGDIILYQGRTFVIYYGTNSWSLTPIGTINDVDAGALREALGAGDVTVTLFLGEQTQDNM